MTEQEIYDEFKKVYQRIHNLEAKVYELEHPELSSFQPPTRQMAEQAMGEMRTEP